MSTAGITIEFEGVDAAQGNINAAELREQLENVDGLTIEQRRSGGNTMDFGATLAIVLGSAAVTAVAKGIEVWLKMRDTGTITIRTPKGEIIATGVSARDVRPIVEQALQQ